MSKATGFVAFTLGAAIGSVATWYFVKTKYEKLAQEEIDSVKEVFSKMKASSSPVEKKVDIPERVEKKAVEETPDIMGYSKKLSEEGYTDYSNIEMSLPGVEVKKITDDVEKPYVITPEEFGDLVGYDTISLTYYADQVLTDDADELVEDVEGSVGFESLNHFGEYEDDSVFVRNDRLQCDYEILLDSRKYSDVRRAKPYLSTGEFYD